MHSNTLLSIPRAPCRLIVALVPLQLQVDNGGKQPRALQRHICMLLLMKFRQSSLSKTGGDDLMAQTHGNVEVAVSKIDDFRIQKPPETNIRGAF